MAKYSPGNSGSGGGDALEIDLGNAQAGTLKSTNARIGDVARSLDLILGSRWDGASDLGTDIATIIAALGSNILASGTLTTNSASAPADTTLGAAYATGFFNGCLLVLTSGTYILARRIIDTFTGGTGVFTPRKPFANAPGLVSYVIVPREESVVLAYKDIWSTSQLNNLTITTAGADKDFPDVVVAAQGSVRGLPLNAIAVEAYLLMMFDCLDTSAAANYIKTAGDDIRVMIDGQAWTDAPIAWTSVDGDWYTPASGMSSQVIIGASNVLLATYGVTVTGTGTYHVGTDETTAGKALEVQGDTLALKNVKTGLRIYYKI
jgi:hypothetical protein